jgi:hypothetical protein
MTQDFGFDASILYSKGYVLHTSVHNGREVCYQLVCSKPRWRETNPKLMPGHYHRPRLRGWCACEELS